MRRKLNQELVLVVKEIETNSNYNLSASVFKKENLKQPLFGTIFKEKTNIKDIVSWANERICNNKEAFNV